MKKSHLALSILATGGIAEPHSPELSSSESPSLVKNGKGVDLLRAHTGLVSLYVLAILGLISDLQDERCKDILSTCTALGLTQILPETRKEIIAGCLCDLSLQES